MRNEKIKTSVNIVAQISTHNPSKNAFGGLGVSYRDDVYSVRNFNIFYSVDNSVFQGSVSIQKPAF